MRMAEAKNGILFVLPWIIGFLGFTLYPILSSLYYSFCDYSVIKEPVFTGVPKEITESSRIDGANEFEIFLKVIMPISKPALASVAIMAFIRAWNDFLGPLVFLGSDRLYTLSLAASMLKSNYDPNWDLLLPLGVVMVLPVLLLFFVLQKYFIQGITMSGIKG